MTPEQIKELDGPIWRLINAYINHCELEGDTDPDDALIHAARVELRDLVACRNTAHDFARRLVAIESLARQYNSPAVNPGAHELAGKLLRLLEERT